MKKRIAVLSFLLLYLSTTVGFALNLHFCGNSLATIQLNYPIKKTCCKQEKTKPNKCCKDIYIKIKVSDQQKESGYFKIPSATSLNLFLFTKQSAVFSVVTDVLSATPSYRGPPHLTHVSLIVKNCIFRI